MNARAIYEAQYRATRTKWSKDNAVDEYGIEDAIWNLMTELEQKRDNVDRYVNPSKTSIIELAAVQSFFNYVHPD